LRDDANIASDKMIDFKGATGGQHDTVSDIDQADRVGPEQPHRPGSFDQLALARLAFGARFGIAAGQHDGGGGAALGQRTHRLMGALGAQQDDADVRRLRQRRHVRVAAQSRDGLGARVDRINIAGEAVLF
jgi:hypothetical protein